MHGKHLKMGYCCAEFHLLFVLIGVINFCQKRNKALESLHNYISQVEGI